MSPILKVAIGGVLLLADVVWIVVKLPRMGVSYAGTWAAMPHDIKVFMASLPVVFAVGVIGMLVLGNGIRDYKNR